VRTTWKGNLGWDPALSWMVLKSGVRTLDINVATLRSNGEFEQGNKMLKRGLV
jgi:hypothetical protein